MKEFYWSPSTATVIYDLAQGRFFCAANPNHLDEYFRRHEGKVTYESRSGLTGSGWWSPPLSAIQVGTYDPTADRATLGKSVIPGRKIQGVSVYYPYDHKAELDGKSTTTFHCVVIAKKNIVRFEAIDSLTRMPLGVISSVVRLNENAEELEARGYRRRVYKYLPKQILRCQLNRHIYPPDWSDPEEDICTAEFFVDCNGMVESPNARRLPPYIFTKWWPEEDLDDDDISKVLGIPLERLCEKNYVGLLQEPFTHNICLTPKWAPIWGSDAPVAISWWYGFFEVIANPFKKPAMTMPGGWRLALEETCFVRVNSFQGMVELLVNPFNPKARVLWEILSGNDNYVADTKDFSVPIVDWPWQDMTLETVVELLKRRAAVQGE